MSLQLQNRLVFNQQKMMVVGHLDEWQAQFFLTELSLPDHVMCPDD